MRRRLLNFLTLLSLMLCVAAVACWVRSHWVSEMIARVGDSRVFVVNSGSGLLLFSLTPADPENEEPGPRPYYVWHRSAATGPPGIIDKGEVVRLGARVRSTTYGWAVVPHWLLVSVTLPGAWLSLVRMRRWVLAKVRLNYGHCPACGYDLRASPGRCPECGTTASAVIRTTPLAPPATPSA